MKKTKKLFGFLLSLCMIVSMLLGSVTTIYATDTVSGIYVKSLPVATFEGSIADAQADIDVPEGYSVSSYWVKWNEEAGDFEKVTSGVFEGVGIYRHMICIDACHSPAFEGEDTIKYADGIDTSELEYWWSSDDDHDSLCLIVSPAVSFEEPVYEVSLSLPEPVPGEKAVLGEVVFYGGDEIISNDNFNISAKWTSLLEYEEIINGNVHHIVDKDVTNQTFKKDHAYQYVLEITPKDGYLFDASLITKINGEEYLFGYESPKKFILYLSFSTFDPIKEIEVKGLPEFKEGNIIPESLELITDVEDVEVYFDCYDENDEHANGTAIIDGQKYYININVSAFGNINLSNDFVLIIDGVKYTPFSLDKYDAFFDIYITAGEPADDGNDDSDDDDVVVVPPVTDDEENKEEDKEDDKPTAPETNDKENTNNGENNSNNANNNNNANKSNKNDKTDSSVNTGDSANMFLWMALAALALGSIVAIRRRKMI